MLLFALCCIMVANILFIFSLVHSGHIVPIITNDNNDYLFYYIINFLELFIILTYNIYIFLPVKDMKNRKDTSILFSTGQFQRIFSAPVV